MSRTPSTTNREADSQVFTRISGKSSTSRRCHVERPNEHHADRQKIEARFAELEKQLSDYTKKMPERKSGI
jgi:hypothetical protein